MLVHFPIALLIFGFVADAVYVFLKKEHWLTHIGFYLLIIGTFTSLAALLTGTLFTAEMTGTAGEVKENHELFAWITTGMTIVTAAFRIYIKIKNLETTDLRWVALSLYALAAISVSITGFYGGSLVYNYMMPL